MTELPCFSAVLQLAREGASAATFRTQVVTPITAIAISARKTPATIATLAPMLPRRRCRRRPRCVLPQTIRGGPRREAPHRARRADQPAAPGAPARACGSAPAGA